MKQNIAKKPMTKETAAMISHVYSIVIDWSEKGEWLIGSGCIALTKRFAKHGVSVHVLPGLEAPSETGDALPLVMIVGANEAGVRKTLDAITPGSAKMYYSSIVKLPV